MPKARGPVQCGCGCRTTLPTGTRVTLYAGRLWATGHLIAYRAARHKAVGK